MRVEIRRDVAEFICLFAKDHHPNEVILILRGRQRGGKIEVNEALIPPFPVFGKGFSSFSLSMMPMDLKLVGTAHSHPSGITEPSVEDLNHMVGRIMIIVGFPYTLSDIHAYDAKGRELPINIT